MDREILLFFESLRSAPLDGVFSLFTWLGSQEVVIPLLCVILWCVNKKLGYRLAVTLFFAQGVNQSLKILFAVPRPWVRWPGLVSPVPAARAAATGFSFPSGHTSSAAAMYPTLAWHGWPHQAQRKQRHLAAAAAGVILLAVALSRVYLGVHTPTDVVAAMLLSGGIAGAIHLAYDRVEQNKWPHGVLVAACWLMVGVTLVVTWTVWRVVAGDATDLDRSLDACKAAGAMAGFVTGWQIERRWLDVDTRASRRVQVLKAVGGLSVLLLLKIGLKPVLLLFLPYPPAAAALRYALVALWATCGLPAVVQWAQSGIRRTPTPG